MSLGDAGRADLAYGIVSAEGYPGFAYMMNGTANNLTNATTLWEAWFASDNTYSHSHPMFGSSTVYLLQSVSGIQPHPEARGFDRVLIKPQPPPPGTLTWANASVTTARGVISTSWTLSIDGTFDLHVVLPPNVRAEVWSPPQRVGTPSSVEASRRELTSGKHVLRYHVGV